jgi:DNA-binding response OmpR family regulator
MADVDSTLEAAGFQVTFVARGHRGLASVYESRPDLVIVSEQVPEINVEELCSRLRQVSHLPIIVLGNSQEGSHEISILEAGADAYMSKPPDAGDLVARVRSLLRSTKGRECPSAGGSPEGNLSARTAKREVEAAPPPLTCPPKTEPVRVLDWRLSKRGLVNGQERVQTGTDHWEAA